MQMTKTQKIILSIVVLVILIGVYMTVDKTPEKDIKKIDDILVSTSTTSTNGEIMVNTGGGIYTIEQVPLSEGKVLPKPIPDLNRKVVVYSGAIIAPEAKAVALENIKSLQDLLKKDASNILAWIDLGIYQKMAGDYDGAIISWKYASKLAPNDYVSVANIGNLYAYFIKDKTQAEFYYKQAITKGPAQSYLYIQLAEVYRDVFKDLDKARAIIEEGLKKIPNDPALLEAKKNLQ